MIRTVSFYNLTTGLFTGLTFSGSDLAVQMNTPAGLAVIDGKHDHLSSRVVDGEVVDWQPPQPDDDHEWNAETKRWQKTAAVVAVETADKAARAQIAAQEIAQSRAIREVVLKLAESLPPTDPARVKLEQIEQTIAAVRPQIQRDIAE
jgi:predicted RNA-binding Zn ribbon-like protein